MDDFLLAVSFDDEHLLWVVVGDLLELSDGTRRNFRIPVDESSNFEMSDRDIASLFFVISEETMDDAWCIANNKFTNSNLIYFEFGILRQTNIIRIKRKENNFF